MWGTFPDIRWQVYGIWMYLDMIRCNCWSLLTIFNICWYQRHGILKVHGLLCYVFSSPESMFGSGECPELCVTGLAVGNHIVQVLYIIIYIIYTYCNLGPLSMVLADICWLFHFWWTCFVWLLVTFCPTIFLCQADELLPPFQFWNPPNNPMLKHVWIIVVAYFCCTLPIRCYIIFIIFIISLLLMVDAGKPQRLISLALRCRANRLQDGCSARPQRQLMARWQS